MMLVCVSPEAKAPCRLLWENRVGTDQAHVFTAQVFGIYVWKLSITSTNINPLK